ncbi:MAG: hypothetical protein OXU34_04310 [Gammaproteobacteria bacterium]|nr:hypothetical protein [Gammaproteobacteria bacterium]
MGTTHAHTQVPVTNEIVSVIWAKKCLEDRNLLAETKADPATKAFGGKASSMQVRAVQNTSDTLNICIPDYAALNDGTLDRLADKQMADVSGGILPLLFIGIPVAVAVVPAAIGVASAGGAFTAAAAAGGAAVAAGVAVGTAAGVGAFNQGTGLYDVDDTG